MADYERLEPWGGPGFALHRHPACGLLHGHDGGNVEHEPDGPHHRARHIAPDVERPVGWTT